MKRGIAWFACVLCLTVTALGYNFRTHHGITNAARAHLLRNPQLFDNDRDFKKLLEDPGNHGYGDLIDMGAGDTSWNGGAFCDDPNPDECQEVHTDEDHREGFLGKRFLKRCGYWEKNCGAACTFDHFLPRLPLPLKSQDALTHFRYYADLAYRLYRAGKCSGNQTYFRWAAMALGHALHLVEDMGSPQHVRPENHGPYPIGHGWSFWEGWGLHAWAPVISYSPDGQTVFEVGQLHLGADRANAPFPHDSVEDVFTRLRRASLAVPARSPYAPGTHLLAGQLPLRFPGSFRGLGPHWAGSHELRLINFWQYPPYHRPLDQYHWPRYVHTFFSQVNTSYSYPRSYPDFFAFGDLDADDTDLRLESDEIALRLWAEHDELAAGGAMHPVEFDAAYKDHMEATTNAVMGAILWFYDQVKGPCDCTGENVDPCSMPGLSRGELKLAGGGRDACPVPSPSFPIPPGGDNVDDNAGVVGTAAVRPGSGEPLTMLVDRHWRELGGLGAERGMAPLVDLARTVWLLGQGAQDLDEAGGELVREAFGRIEAAYSGDALRPEQVLGGAPRVAVLDNGFVGGAETLLERMGLVYAVVDPLFDPGEAAGYDVLLVPSGGLYGMGGSEGVRERLAAYVEGGGTLIVMAQMRGEDFAAVPVPEGEALEALGWVEDQSCWWGSLTQAARHPALASVRGGRVPEPVDGSIVRWPEGAEVLLRRAGSGAPALLTYGLGAGRVVVSTLYGDWAEANGGEPWDGYRVLRDLVLWGLDPEMERPLCRVGEPCSPQMPVTLRNVGGEDADRVVWSVRELWPATESWTAEHLLDVPAGAEVAATATPELGMGAAQWPGLLPLRYRLEDSARTLHTTVGTSIPWLVQPEAMAGQIVLADWPAELEQAPPAAVTVSTPQEDWPADAVVPVHLTVAATGEVPVTGTVVLESTPGPAHWGRWRAVGSFAFTAEPGNPWELDLEAGPLALTAGHDGMAGGGTLRARVYLPGLEAPVAEAFRSVLRNRRRMEIELQASAEEAAPGDEVHVFGSFSNQTMAGFRGRYRLVVRDEYNVFGTPAEQTIRLPWRDFSVAPAGSAQLDEVFTVPGDWQGRADATLYLCYPYQECWEDGEEAHGSSPSAWVNVGLPLARAAVALGPPELAPGPVLRLPVTVRSTGPRVLEGGLVSVWVEGGASQEIGPFTLAPYGEQSFQVELPVGAPQGPDGALAATLRARVRQEGVPQVEHRSSRWVSYRTDLGYPVAPVVEPGQQEGTVSLRVANPSNIPASFDLTVTAPAVGLGETRHLVLAAGQELEQVFPFQVAGDLAYGSYPVEATLDDGVLPPRSVRGTLWRPAPHPDLALYLPAEHPHARGEAEVEVAWTEPGVAVSVPALLEVSVPGTGFSESRQVTLAPGQGGAEVFTVGFPADTAPGEYPVRAALTDALGLEIRREAALYVPWDHATVERVAAEPVAGGSVTYRAGNDGGAAAAWQASWRLERGSEVLAWRTLDLPLAPGETADLVFHLPADLASGGYVSSFCAGSACLTEDLQIAGAAAGLHLETSQPVYRPWETIEGTASIANGGVDLPGARLHLEVVDEHRRVVPWGMYQGSALRDGAAEGLGPANFSLATWTWGEINVESAVAGDVNGDGFDDVVALAGWGGSRGVPEELAVYLGPDLEPGPGLPLPSGLTSASVAVADADADGAPEIYLCLGSSGGLTVRRLDGGLTTAWERALPGPVGPALGPAAGLVLADLDGDGRSEVVVASDRTVTALEAAGGSVVWTAGDGALPEEAAVTGLAAGVAGGSPRLMVTAAGSSGGVLLALGAEGGLRWQAELEAPPAGCPVLFHSGGGEAVAVVVTPADPSLSSVLEVFDRGTGTRLAASSVWFRSAFQPAAGDVDGDGAQELVVGTESGVVAFELSAGILWDVSTPMPAQGPPALIDCDGDGLVDVVTAFGDGQWMGEVRMLRGVDGSGLAGPAEGTGAATVLDAGGDWRAELFFASTYGGGVLYGLEGGGGWGSRSAGAGRRKVLWSWDGTLDLSAQDTLELAEVLDTQSELGQFLFRGEVRNAMGQLLAWSQVPFSVQDETAEVLLDPLPAAAPGRVVEVSGTVGLAAGPKTALGVELLVDGESAGAQTLDVADGETAPFVLQTVAPPEGEHEIRIVVRDGAQPVGSATRLLEVETPRVGLEVTAPGMAGSAPFPVRVELTNPTGLEEALELRLLPGDDPPREVVLPPYGSALEVFERAVADDTQFVARVTGDATAQATADTSFDARVQVTLPGDTVLPAGAHMLTVMLANSGTRWFTGDLQWRFEGAAGGSGTMAVSLAGGEERAVDLPLVLGSGAGRLVLDLGSEHAEANLTGYEGGMGTAVVSVPYSAVAGQVPVPVTLSETGGFGGSFRLELEAAGPGGGPAAAAARTWTLEAGASTQDTVWLTLPEGDYTVSASLNGNALGQWPLQVLPERRVEVEMELGSPGGDGSVPLDVTVRNRGGAEAWVASTVACNGLHAGAEGALPPGGSRVDHFTVAADAAAGGSLTAHVVVGDGAGAVDTERDLTLELPPGELELVAAPEEVAGDAGARVPVPITVRNAGGIAVPCEVHVEAAGGGAGTAVARTEVAGGEERTVEVGLDVPADIPSSAVEGRYWVLACPDGSDCTQVASGFFVLRVHGLELQVQAALDRDHAGSGETVTLTAEVSAPQAAAPVALTFRVGYGSFSTEQPLDVTAAPQTVSVEVPVDQPGGDVRFGLFWPSGRAAYLDQRTVHSSEGPVVLSTDREEYLPGQTVEVTAQIPEGTELELRTLEGSLVFGESGSQSFVVPDGTPYGRYPLLWTLTGSAEADSGTYDIKVRGPRVRILHVEPPRGPVEPGQPATARVTVASDSDVDAALRAWVVAPDGSATSLDEVPLLLVAGDLRRMEVPFTVEGAAAGTCRLVTQAVSPAGRPLATAQALFEVGASMVLGVSTDRPAYRPGNPVTARVTVTGVGTAELSVLLDGAAVHTESLTLAGRRVVTVGLGPAEAGAHTVAAELAAGPYTARRSTGFDVLTPPLSIDAQGVIDGAVVGEPYRRMLEVSGGAPGYAWELADGELPPGITLEPGTGTLAGTPTTPGTWVAVVSVADGTGQEASAGIRITVAAEPLEVLTAELPVGRLGEAYAAALTAAGGTPPYLWRVTDGALPPGLQLDAASGEITGQPEAAGAALFSVEAVDFGGLRAERAFELVVTDRAPAVPALGGAGRVLLSLLLAGAAVGVLRRWR